jgi:type IV pilus assembly protein PilC
MLFTYKSIDASGQIIEGTIDAIDVDVAIGSLQRRGLVIEKIKPVITTDFIVSLLSVFNRVKNKDIVIISRQIATMFGAQVSALRVFRLLAAEYDNVSLKEHLIQIADDIQAGSSISKAMSKHPGAFSNFYVGMVRAGEESGKLDETFSNLADYLERSYEMTSKAKTALIYPGFVLFTFIVVMVLMLTKVIPSLSAMLMEAGQKLPIYTTIVIGVSDFFVNYGLFLLIALIGGGFALWRYKKTEEGSLTLTILQMKVPFLGDVMRKLSLTRLSDNLNTMLVSAVPIIHAIEMTADVVDNPVYRDVLLKCAESVKGGSSLSDAMSRHAEIPGTIVQMVKIGEETGELGNMLKTVSRFYERETKNAIDAMVSLIEPAMIVLLAGGVAILLASILLPIYNLAGSIR